MSLLLEQTYQVEEGTVQDVASSVPTYFLEMLGYDADVS